MKAKRARIADPPMAHGASQLISLIEIEPDPNNVRQKMDKAKLQELTESIREKGVIQPILLCPHQGEADSPVRYRIIAGERRYRAATAAGYTEIPAIIWEVKEGEELDLQLIENLQREDVHPLDEALGFERMKEGLQLDVKALAQRLGKDARYIARRLALTALIPAAWQDFRQERITLGHALEICRLTPTIQTDALAQCYETKVVWDEEQRANVMLPDKEKPVRHVRYLQEWITRNVYLNLTDAPFQLEDPNLHPDALTCLACPNRSGYNKMLFADIKEKDTCLNPPCYQDKLRTFVQLQKNALETKSGQPVSYISAYYGGRYEAQEVLSRDEYHLLPKRADRCRFAEQAIYADGAEIGRVKWICREEVCKVHRGRNSVLPGSVNGNGAAPTQDRNRRKQEIFDIKVDEATRLRAFKQALPTYLWPLDRAQLNQVALEFFERIPASDQKTIFKVLGWEEEKTRTFRFQREQLQQELNRMEDHALAQFLMLCSFAHYGANPARTHRVGQSAVVQLCQERGLNHTLLDAEVRLALCPKKYKERHQDYLVLVKQGHPASKPSVCEKLPQAIDDSVAAPLTIQAIA
jgi:ParB family transcriptional regulator, chromosome partitioning protein